MKIFDWMQSKLTRIKKPSSKVFDDDKVPKSPKEEANNDQWPHGLLAIGTLGNGDLKEDHQQSNPPPSPKAHLHDFTPEEAIHFQNELNSYLIDEQSSSATPEFETAHKLNKFLNRQSSFKPERTTSSNADCDECIENNVGRFQRSTSVVLSRGKDVRLENTSNAIGKKSLSFLLKKVFVCRSGFAPAAAPGLRDPSPESESTMEKILKAILHEKIYPHSSTAPTMSMKKYLESRHNPKSCQEDEIIDKGIDSEKIDEEGSKWVKTDSEYIVLEI